MWLKVRSSTHQVYVVNAKGKGKVIDLCESLDRNKKMKCFYYGKKGHMANECCKKETDAKNDILKKPKSANPTKMIEVEHFIVVEESCIMETHYDEWIIVNRAS